MMAELKFLFELLSRHTYSHSHAHLVNTAAKTNSYELCASFPSLLIRRPVITSCHLLFCIFLVSITLGKFLICFFFFPFWQSRYSKLEEKAQIERF